MAKQKYFQELKLYAEGKTEGEIAQQMGVSRGTIQFRLKGWRDAGILSGSYKYRDVTVDWDKASAGADDTAEGKALDNAIDNADIKEDKADVRQKASGQKGIRIAMSHADEQILQRLIDREKARERAEAVYSGERQNVTFRLDTGLYQALRDQADRDGVTVIEALKTAIEGYLKA